VRSPPAPLPPPCPEEEGTAEVMCDELTATPIPCPPALLGGGGRETCEKTTVLFNTM